MPIETFYILRWQKSITVIEELNVNLNDLSCDTELHVAIQINMAIS